MLVQSDLTSKDTSLWSSGICTVLIASMKFYVDCSLCRDLSVKGLRMLVKCFESWQVGDPQNETMGRIGMLGLWCSLGSPRLTEHKRATKKGDLNNNIAEHHLKTSDAIDWDSATCLTNSTDYYQRITLDSWFTNLEQTALNRCQPLPAP